MAIVSFHSYQLRPLYLWFFLSVEKSFFVCNVPDVDSVRKVSGPFLEIKNSNCHQSKLVVFITPFPARKAFVIMSTLPPPLPYMHFNNQLDYIPQNALQ